MIQVELLNDAAIYQRTPRGQQELLGGPPGLSQVERRLLALFTGLSEVRVLLELGLDATETHIAIQRLLDLGLIKLVPTPE